MNLAIFKKASFVKYTFQEAKELTGVVKKNAMQISKEKMYLQTNTNILT